METFTIVLGNKAYSSWSLRGWLPLAQTGVAFDEVVVPLRRPESRPEILRHSPSGKVPALLVGDGAGASGRLTICDSLAIAEYLAERFPEAGLWPEDPAQRALARAAAAEMHAGFAALRARLPMDLRSRHPRRSWDDDVMADIERVLALWRGCRADSEAAGEEGPFLFGGFTVADAFYAPVVLRFLTYDVALDPVSSAYRDAVLSWPAMTRWIAAAEREPWTIDFSE